MINPELEKAKQIVAEYKAHNLNTVERSVQVGPKTWLMKKVKIDERAKDLVEKLDEMHRSNSKKTTKKTQTYSFNPKPKRIERMREMYRMTQQKMTYEEIAPKFGLIPASVQKEVYAYRKLMGIKFEPRDIKSEVLVLIKKGYPKYKIREELKISTSALYNSIKKLLQEFPDLEICQDIKPRNITSKKEVPYYKTEIL